jgi:hypothetical protein
MFTLNIYGKVLMANDLSEAKRKATEIVRKIPNHPSTSAIDALATKSICEDRMMVVTPQGESLYFHSMREYKNGKWTRIHWKKYYG